MDAEIREFRLDIPQEALDDLRARLAATRWPEAELVADWSQGAPLAKIKSLVEYWRTNYDWRRCESALNAIGQFKTNIDGLDIHFLHAKSPHEHALPLILTHGWPGSVIEFAKTIGPLTRPEAYGGDIKDAFHVVAPSLPGFGFSNKPAETGWGPRRIATAWAILMQRLGYNRYVAQGGDWGAVVTTALGVMKPEGLAAIHLNLPFVLPEGPYENLNSEEAAMLDSLAYYDRWDSGYSKQQMTRPQTIGYALADSPVGQAAWIYEKYQAWSDCGDSPENVFSYDDMLDNIMMYWLPNAAASSARIYWESFAGAFAGVPVDLPVGCAIYPKELYKAPRSWADRVYKNLFHWAEMEYGGHFAAFERPGLFVKDIQTCFRKVR